MTAEITNTKKKCKHCGSTKTKKYGMRSHWKAGIRLYQQRYICNECGCSTFEKIGGVK